MLLSHSSSFAVNGRHFLSWPLSTLSPTLPLGGGWSRLSGVELGRRNRAYFPDFSSLAALESESSIGSKYLPCIPVPTFCRVASHVWGLVGNPTNMIHSIVSFWVYYMAFMTGGISLIPQNQDRKVWFWSPVILLILFLKLFQIQVGKRVYLLSVFIPYWIFFSPPKIYLRMAALGLCSRSGLSPVFASGSYSLLPCTGFPLWWRLLFWSMGSRVLGLQ